MGDSDENVETVRRAVAAINARDLDAYLDCCTDDVELLTPAAEIGGAYEGHDAIRRFLTDISDTSPDFHLEIERAEATADDQVVAFMRVSASGRASGIAVMTDSPTINVYDFAGSKIRRIRIFLDRREALDELGLQGLDAQAGS
jgi:ketosteroid isomerase-like protein